MIEPSHETAKPVHGARVTEHLVSLMRIFEAFTLDCFWKRAPFFVDSGTLLGCVRHNGIIPPSLRKVVALTDKPQEGRGKNQQR
jgi:hypothetical protein